MNRNLIEQVFRAESSRIVAGLIRQFRDFDIADDAVQDAFSTALVRWPMDGMPQNPAAWITTTAQRRAIDRLRQLRSARLRPSGAFAEVAAVTAEPVEEGENSPPAPIGDLGDERLSLMFTCCHPALNLDAQVALTLKLVAGLRVSQIAHAFLASETTIAQRIVRAKRKIREAGIPFRSPEPAQLVERLSALLAVIYLVFNEGYVASRGPQLLQVELTAEAIRLARIVSGMLPADPEVLGLLALMLLQDSRRIARCTAAGEFVPLHEQDRRLWDRDAIGEGLQLLGSAGRPDPPGPYLLQARIAAIHSRAASAAATDWAEIVRQYDTLSIMYPSPVVELNRAIALSMAEGPERGLALLERRGIAESCADYHYYYAARADLLRKLGRFADAGAQYQLALERTANAAERRWLAKQRDCLPEQLRRSN